MLTELRCALRRERLPLRGADDLDTAAELVGVKDLEETLKWRESSYLTTGGSTLRMDWKEKAPEQYAIYFNCNTLLVATFKKVYGMCSRSRTTEPSYSAKPTSCLLTS